MLETVVVPIIVVVILLGSFLFAKHMDTIRMQAWLDKKIIIEKWIKYRRIKVGIVARQNYYSIWRINIWLLLNGLVNIPACALVSGV